MALWVGLSLWWTHDPLPNIQGINLGAFVDAARQPALSEQQMFAANAKGSQNLAGTRPSACSHRWSCMYRL